MSDSENLGGLGDTHSVEKPYLRGEPDGIVGDLIVEWLEFLVSEVGIRDTSEVIEYYETIDWLTEAVAAQLGTYLGKFESGKRASLTADHHRRGPAYIDQLSGSEIEPRNPVSVDGGEHLC